MTGRAWRVGAPLALLLLVAGGVWTVFSGARAVDAASDLQRAVNDVESALAAADVGALQRAAIDAQDAATRADAALGGPVWAGLAAVPYLGDTPEAARVSARAISAAADGLEPLVSIADVLDPQSLYDDGRIDVQRLEQAQTPLAAAADALGAASEIIDAAPTSQDGAWVLGAVDTRVATATQQLAEATRALTTASAAADVMPAILGADGPRTWFVALQSPAEARGTGGFMGTYLLLEADDGRLEVTTTGSNTDFDVLTQLPDFGEQFRYRYGNEPALILNSNLSPHFPYAAEIWQAFAAESLDVAVDVVFSTDVVAVGSLVEAMGGVSLPDGRVLDADEFVQFALADVYEEFPNANRRKRFQEQVAESVFDAVTSGAVPGPRLVSAVGSMIADDRVRLWSPRADEEERLLALPTAGSVAAQDGPYALVALNNGTGSKLETYLERTIAYEVGRCEGAERVQSQLEVTLLSDIPSGADLGRYVTGLAEIGPKGPISTIQLQVHLSPDAAVDSVTLDGEPIDTYAFREQGRPAFLVVFDLTPGEASRLLIDFNEPSSDLDAEVPVQPLARPADVQITHGLPRGG